MAVIKRQKLDFVSKVREIVTRIVNLSDGELGILKNEMVDLDIANTLANADLTGSVHEGIDAADIILAANVLATLSTAISNPTNRAKLNKIKQVG